MSEYNGYLYGQLLLMGIFIVPTIICMSVLIYFIVDTIKRNPSRKKRPDHKKVKKNKKRNSLPRLSRKE